MTFCAPWHSNSDRVENRTQEERADTKKGTREQRVFILQTNINVAGTLTIPMLILLIVVVVVMITMPVITLMHH